MERKFKSGDRVKLKPSAWLSCFFTEGVDYVGTVIDYDEDGDILVKFDNFGNRQHFYVREENLCLLEGE